MTRSKATTLPDALTDAELRGRLRAQPVALFLDYDGTLTPIVARPELAVLDARTRAALQRLAAHTVVGVISGRDLDDVRAMVGVDGLWYAGSHGFEIAWPDGTRIELEGAAGSRPVLAAAADELDAAVAAIPGAWVERKAYADAVHFRQVDDALIPEIERAVDGVVERHPGLRKTGGKRVLELRPDVPWDKGRALWALVEQAGLSQDDALAVFVGDDVTDEDAFAALDAHGVGIVVTDDDRETAAGYRLRDAADVSAFLDDLAQLVT